MVCSKCKKDYGIILITIRDRDGEYVFCPNCLCYEYCEGNLIFNNNPSLCDDVTGEEGAVEYISFNEHYVLEKERMLRLIAHNLKPNEYLALSNKYGADKFSLHDDFYTDDGYAIQPVEV